MVESVKIEEIVVVRGREKNAIGIETKEIVVEKDAEKKENNRRNDRAVEDYKLATDLGKEVRALIAEGITGVIDNSTRARIKELTLRKMVKWEIEATQIISSQTVSRSSQPTFEEFMAKVNSGEESLFLQDYPLGVYDPKREWLVDFEEIAGFDTAHLTTEVVMNRPLNGLVWPCRDAMGRSSTDLRKI